MSRCMGRSVLSAQLRTEFPDSEFALASLTTDLQKALHVRLGTVGAQRLLKQIGLILQTLFDRFGVRCPVPFNAGE